MPRSLRRPVPAGLGAETGGAVDLATCRASGVSLRQVKWLIASGRWQLIFPRVYAVFSGPIPLLTRMHAALLYAGEDAVLSHETAGGLWRLCPHIETIHVTVPIGRSVAPQPMLVVHRSRALGSDDVHPVAQPRRTRVERTVVDLLSSRRSADEALGLVADAVRARLTTPDRLARAVAAKPTTRWRGVVLDALPDIRAGAQSILEVRDVRIRRRHGLPLGRRQMRRQADGTEFLDVLVEEFGLHTELDGRLGHDRGREIWRDMRRDNRSERMGLRHLRYGWADIVDRPCEVAIEQAVILRQQGWAGRFVRCPHCPASLPPELQV